MTSSTNFSSKTLVILFTLLVCFSVCSAAGDFVMSLPKDTPASQEKLLTAILPLSNLSGSPAPLSDIRQLIINSFRKRGLKILDEETLERFISRHRIRYLGGINSLMAQDFREETGAKAVLITSVDLYSERPPPKIAITSRLVSTGDDPTILWMDGVGLAGDDSVGLLGLSLIEDPHKLLKKAVLHLSASFGKYLSSERYVEDTQRKIVKFWPQVFYRSPIIDLGTKHTLAVVPFVNLSERKFAGEIMGFHFVRQLRVLQNLTILEPGVVRKALLQLRIIMDDGISFADTDALFSSLDADLILGGKIFDYQDYQGATGRPKVDFSALLIDRKSREVVWYSESHHRGDDGVFFFDWGKINTAQRLASEMVASALNTLVE